MSDTKRINGAILATAAAAFFMTLPMIASADRVADSAEAKGHCVGGNACKGQSACKAANSECKGQNACKGQGFTEATKAECDEAGGEYKEA